MACRVFFLNPNCRLFRILLSSRNLLTLERTTFSKISDRLLATVIGRKFWICTTPDLKTGVCFPILKQRGTYPVRNERFTITDSKIDKGCARSLRNLFGMFNGPGLLLSFRPLISLIISY